MKLSFATKGLAAAAVVAFSVLPARASDDALIDALVRKGVISQRDAEQIKDKSSKDLNTTAATQVIHFGDSIKNLTLYGDVRLRAELRNGTYGPGEINGNTGTQYTAGGSQDRSRLRYRVRMGINADLYDNFFAGVGIATNPNNNKSGNVTFATSGSAGPFGKAQGLVAINKVFIGWKNDYFMVEAGQFDNPLYTTNLTWDPNITPTGFAEQYHQDFGNLGVFATAGQFEYNTAGSNNSSATPGANFNFATFRLDEQVGIKYKFDKDIEFKGAVDIATYTNTKESNGSTALGQSEISAAAGASQPLNQAYSGAGNGVQPNDFGGPFTGYAPGPFANDYAINNLFILDIPVELKWKAWGIPMRAFADVSWNLDAQGRSNAAQTFAQNAIAAVKSGAVGASGLTASQVTAPEFLALNRDNSNQNMAYKVGLEAGKLKDKGDWMGQVYWMDREYNALDTNLVDSDIWDGRTNLQGFVLQANYQVTKGLTGTVTYGQASRACKALATPGDGQDLNLGSIDTYRVVQADLQWKF
jgi:hypothetical protein